MTVDTTINVSVYDIQAGEKDDKEVAANTVKDVVDGNFSAEEAFGEDHEATSANLNTAMNSGAIITTRVIKEDSTDETAKAKIDAALASVNVANIKYFDVKVLMEENGDLLGYLHKLTNKLTVALAEVDEQAPAGYERKFYVVAYHEGDDQAIILTEGVDYKIVDGVVYIMSDRFSTFAVAYEDVPVENDDSSSSVKSPDTGFYTFEKASATNNNIVGLIAVLASVAFVGSSAVISFARKH